MRKLIVVLAGALLCAVPAAADPIINAGFETGTLAGWTLVDHLPGQEAQGLGQVVSHWPLTNTPTWFPVEGNYFAVLSSGVSTAVYTTLSQEVPLAAGDVLTGWAGFDAEDEMPFNDDAFVRVLGATGLVATPWSRSIANVGDLGGPAWFQWSWTALSAGTYTLQFGVENIGDNQMNSFALFDAVQTTVPEPASLVLLGSGLGLSALRRRLRRQK